MYCLAVIDRSIVNQYIDTAKLVSSKLHQSSYIILIADIGFMKSDIKIFIGELYFCLFTGLAVYIRYDHLAPSSANNLTIPLPIPWLPPVTMATLFFNLIIS